MGTSLLGIIHEPGDFGGNLETLLPSTTYPLGRIVMGNDAGNNLRSFLTAQEFQSPIYSISCDWLKIGHIDEVAALIARYGTPAKPRILMADSQTAINLLETNFPATDTDLRERRLFFAYGPSLTVASNILVAAVNATDVNPNVIRTGIDHTVGPNYQYIRFLSGVNIGKVCKVTRDNGFLFVTDMWDTGVDIEQYCSLVTSGLPGTRTMSASAVGDKFVMVQDTLWWFGEDTAGGFPAVVSVLEVLAKKNGQDNYFVGRNRVKVQDKLTAISNDLIAAAGTPAPHVTPIPCLYFGEIENSELKLHSWKAWTPNSVNLHHINGVLYAPRQYGPRDGDGAGGNDIFETAITNSVPGAGSVKFVDSWSPYHTNDGEVHCGSNVKRSLPANNSPWWQFIP